MNGEKHSPQSHAPAYGPLVQVCEQHGIGRTTCFRLVREGLLETFRIGARRYVYLSSVASLPDRLAGHR
jgi:hypothetical protein